MTKDIRTEKIIYGDSLHVLKTMEDNSVDSVVTDPPYGLSKEPDINEVMTKWLAGEEYDHGHGGFMGKSWDSFVPHPDLWREVIRVLKPGGHALVFAGTRTQDLMTVSLRIAGFEVRDVIEWIYATGFPKSHDVSKAFDRRAGAEREVVGKDPNSVGRTLEREYIVGTGVKRTRNKFITTPATDLARKWDGWGTALKPSHEPIIVVRKPLIDAETGRKLTVADCVEKYGTGAINVDATRIGNESRVNQPAANKPENVVNYAPVKSLEDRPPAKKVEGRFPANCITLDSDQFYSKYFNVTPNVSPAELSKKASKKDRNSDWQGEEIDIQDTISDSITVGSLFCVDCGVVLGGNKRSECKELGHVIENRKHIKAPVKNSHPTVKPTDLMAWLVRLVTPPNGTVLDPFAGSGSTLVAAKREGFGFIGVGLTEEYIPIIEARVGAKAMGVEHINATKISEKETI